MIDHLPILIGFAGRKRSGKTTAAELLMQGHGFIGISFAQPMRVFVAEILGMNPEQLEAAKEEPIAWLDGATPRHMLQTLGTEWGRQLVHPELWVRVCMRAADHARQNGYAVVLSDVRFPNEAEALRERGGHVIEIERPDLPAPTDGHASETPLPRDLIDYTVVNDGDRAQLYSRLVDTLKAARVRRSVSKSLVVLK